MLSHKSNNLCIIILITKYHPINKTSHCYNLKTHMFIMNTI